MRHTNCRAGVGGGAAATLLTSLWTGSDFWFLSAAAAIKINPLASEQILSMGSPTEFKSIIYEVRAGPRNLMWNCCKVPSTLSARHLTLIHNKMSLTVNPCTWPDNEIPLSVSLTLSVSLSLSLGTCCLKWRRQPPACSNFSHSFFFLAFSNAC